ncbi:MAG: hypothetical protein LBI15_02385 [Dysgonamonadaceae bacterium]|jgi:tetratricopeptide (TPR) repeat protein|nr:hypothetical protein [Dysgonamonadaceae bacterium]
MNKIFSLCALMLFTAISCGQSREKNAHEQALNYALEAEELFVQGDTIAALQLYDKAIALDSLQSQWFFRRGMMRRVGNLLSVEDFKKSVELDPEFVNGHILIASALYRERKYVESIYHSERVLSLNPDAWEMGYGLGLAYYYVGEFEKSIANLKMYDAMDKDRRWVNYYFGLSYKGLGDMEQAKLFLIRAAEQGIEEAKNELEKLDID